MSRWLPLQTFIICLFAITRFSQSKGQRVFAITLINKSSNLAFFDIQEKRDTIRAHETKYVRRILSPEGSPFYLFIYAKDSTARDGLRYRDIFILYDSVKDRKVVIEDPKKVILLSNKSESLYDFYVSNKNHSNFWSLTDSVVRKNPDNLGSAAIIMVNLCSPEIPTDSIKRYYNKLSPTTRSTKFGLSISDYIKGRGLLQIDSLVRNFSLMDTSGKMISLNNIRSEYVLLDFWFSRCGPCIKTFPSLIALYNRLDRNKFEVIGISIDNENEKAFWKSTIAQNRLPWINLLDPKYEIASKRFAIGSYPATILVDRNRRIVRINPSNADLESIVLHK